MSWEIENVSVSKTTSGERENICIAGEGHGNELTMTRTCRVAGLDCIWDRSERPKWCRADFVEQ